VIALTHKTFELDTPGWIAALMDARINERKKNILSLKHFRKPEKSTNCNQLLPEMQLQERAQL